FDPSKFNNPPTPFEESLYFKNAYYLSQPQNDRNIYVWKFNRVIKHSINPSDILSYFGYTSKYDTQPYIESSIQNIPFPNMFFNANFSSNQAAKGIYYAMIQLVTDSYVVREEKEQSFSNNNNRGKSILSLLGVIGGIWSFMAAFYVFLFGFGLISPWGIVQKSKLFKNKYKKKLSPFALDLQSDEPDNEEKSDAKEYDISSIKKQLDNLTKRVQFYESIIDISLLDYVKD
ncbi:13950_t:CDS:2, partial [Dentiscutata heterogama]